VTTNPHLFVWKGTFIKLTRNSKEAARGRSRSACARRQLTFGQPSTGNVLLVYGVFTNVTFE
jgi:hypothetical protein